MASMNSATGLSSECLEMGDDSTRGTDEGEAPDQQTITRAIPGDTHSSRSSKLGRRGEGTLSEGCASDPPSSARYATTGPKPTDILLGRGRGYQNHLGNISMRRLVDRHKERYNQCHRDARGDIATELMEHLLANGVRFLKRVVDIGASNEPEVWEEASRPEIYDKMCHLLRAGRRKREKTSSSAPSSENVPRRHVVGAPQAVTECLLQREPTVPLPASTSSIASTAIANGTIPRRAAEQVAAATSLLGSLSAFNPAAANLLSSHSVPLVPSSLGTHTHMAAGHALIRELQLAQSLNPIDALNRNLLFHNTQSPLTFGANSSANKSHLLEFLRQNPR